MAPVIVQGDEVLFDTQLTPRHGDVVLVADALGQWWLRHYQAAADGSWQARPQSPEPLHATFAGDAGTVVLGVCEGTRGRRAR